LGKSGSQAHQGRGAIAGGEQGWIVPVIRDADQKLLLKLAGEVDGLAARVRAQSLKLEEVQGGTFTITNYGVSGSLMATPIIHQPQCAILGVGRIQKRAVAINDAIAIRPMASLAWTFDHRILDGAIADGFLWAIVRVLSRLA
jgi:pyruvate/2-oxoglutarate dehydrogenase complex dihydrolipoamide acyltransferase (E2) component